MSATSMRIVSASVGGTDLHPFVVAVDHCGKAWFTRRVHTGLADAQWTAWERLPVIAALNQP